MPQQITRRNLNTVVESNLVTDNHQDASGTNKLPSWSDPDGVLARRVRALRETSDLTQREIADKMTAAGYRMHQTTIAKIESGERPVYVGEAVALAGILGVSLEQLLTEPPEGLERNLAEAQIEYAALDHQRARIQERLNEAREVTARIEEELHHVMSEQAMRIAIINTLTSVRDGKVPR